jgi:MoaA/NifB/PqqE/SkfB family radical SAM enzyme
MVAGKRVDIKVGFGCNNNCAFCVQAHKRGLGDRTTEQVVSDLKQAVGTGCSGVVFTGGEPTIRKDILELVGRAKELGFKTIQIQTNGRMLAYKNFCEKLVAAGVNEFSPAVHGHIAALHDFLTGSPGSFSQVVQGIRNIKALRQTVITNTVVVKPNYRNLPEIARLLVSLGVDQFQFAFVHPVGNAYKNFDSVVPRISMAAPFIHRALKVGIDAGRVVMAEAMPYCLMKGYEDYVSERFIPPTEIRDADITIPDYGKVRKAEGKAKFPQCRKCKYDAVCEGPWKEYPEKRGNDEFQPVVV